jgi:sulfate transport system ATP-binding protein
LEVADRVVVMNAGRIEQVGTPGDVWTQPSTPFVYGFLGDVNQIQGHAAGGMWRAAGVALPAPAFEGTDEQRAVAYVRPHELEVLRYAPATDGIAVTLNHAYLAGPSAFLELAKEDGGLLEAQLPEEEFRSLGLRDGETLLARPRRGRIFASAG